MRYSAPGYWSSLRCDRAPPGVRGRFRLTSAPLREQALWQEKQFDERTRHLHLGLAPGIFGASAADVGRIALSKPAWQAAASIHASCIKHASLREPVYPYCGFPVSGQTTLRARGRWLSHGGTPRSTFLAFRLVNCTHPFPFSSLSYELDRATAFRRRSQRNSPPGKGGEGKLALLRHREDQAVLGDRDPSRHRAKSFRQKLGVDRFPDLQRKPVWLEKLEVATSADVLLMRPDGSVNLLTFGEPAIGGSGRPTDVIVSPVPRPETERDALPQFVRVAIEMARNDLKRKSVEARVQVVTAPGYSQPVFDLPLLVDTDGVFDRITLFTRSSGRTRQRRACFLRVSTPSEASDRGLLLALEGSHHRAPPTLNEVPRVDIRLVAQILAKKSVD